MYIRVAEEEAKKAELPLVSTSGSRRREKKEGEVEEGRRRGREDANGLWINTKKIRGCLILEEKEGGESTAWGGIMIREHERVMQKLREHLNEKSTGPSNFTRYNAFGSY